MTDRAAHSTLGPLRQPLFRGLWLSSFASYLGTWIHEVAANWLMTSLAPTPLMVSLIQTAQSLPVFLLVLVAGALADVVDRRRLLLVAQAWMLLAATVLGLLTLSGGTTARSLLVLTFLLSLGSALNGPAWQAIVPELVPRAEVPAAVAVTSVGFNLARAVGPALGGLVVGFTSPAGAFFLNAISFMAVIVVLGRWKRPKAESVLPTERVFGALRTGLRYVRHAPAVRSVLVRVVVFVMGASALWSLLPLYALQNLNQDAFGYGILLGCLGAGAVVGGTVLASLRRQFGVNTLLAASTALFGGALALLGLSRTFAFACFLLLSAGAGWTILLSSLNTTVQLTVPSWVRGRALAVYHLAFFGAMAAGSAAWGAAAMKLGIPVTFLCSGVAVVSTLLAAFRYRVQSGEEIDLEPFLLPAPVVAAEPHPDRGPVLVTVEYRIDPSQSGPFTQAMRDVGRVRRRDGAMRWGLFEDVAEPGRFVESFLVESWVEHLRQHERSTVADRQAEQRVREFHIGERPPVVGHFLYAYHDLPPQEIQPRPLPEE